jgi:hypothetical protein
MGADAAASGPDAEAPNMLGTGPGTSAGEAPAKPEFTPENRLASNVIEPGRFEIKSAEVRTDPALHETERPRNIARNIRGFRFLQAPESLRERELEARLGSLENQLETTARRIKFNDSESVRIDAQLDRARLESDLDLVYSAIGRLRLERAFNPSADQPEMRPAETAEQAFGLDLLA